MHVGAAKQEQILKYEITESISESFWLVTSNDQAYIAFFFFFSEAKSISKREASLWKHAYSRQGL